MNGQPHILDRIMARKREEVAERRAQTSEGALVKRAVAAAPPRGFASALVESARAGRPAVIAEVKRASPSKGLIYAGEGPFDPAAIAAGYAVNGAACISCLTDRDFFQGDDAFLAAIRERVERPVLRKDFLYDPWQVVESRALGADAVLLIMAVLETGQARELEAAAMEFRMDVLVEVHDEAELEAAHELRTPLLGINNRNLKTFETTLETTLRLMDRAEKDRLIVSESGIRDAADVRHLRDHGVHAFLVGESLMRESDPGQALARLLAA